MESFFVDNHAIGIAKSPIGGVAFSPINFGGGAARDWTLRRWIPSPSTNGSTMLGNGFCRRIRLFSRILRVAFPLAAGYAVAACALRCAGGGMT